MPRPARATVVTRPAQVLAPLSALVGAGCSSGYGAPDSVTDQGDTAIDQWRLLLLLSVVLGAVVVAAIAWAIVRYRARDERLPRQDHGNLGIELVALAVPLLVVSGLFVYIIQVREGLTGPDEDAEVQVEVTAYRWGWRFDYPEEDVAVIAGPGEEPEMVLPVDATVRFHLRSDDVIHSFFVPRFVTKLDVIPDAPSELDLHLTETGTFDGHCAEFCGLDHARMNFVVRVEEADAYQDWLDDRRAAA